MDTDDDNQYHQQHPPATRFSASKGHFPQEPCAALLGGFP